MSGVLAATTTSIARGLGVLAVLAAVLVAGRHLWRAAAGAPPAPVPVCARPVEVVEAGERRLGCADALRACGAARGDRVELTDGLCRVTDGGMSAATRLAAGMGLDLNRATAAELELLPGIGPRRAAAIVADRAARGAFRSVADLDRVAGIGPATVEALGGAVTVETP